MFPLIPALILMLLQGQPALERGRTPLTFDGLPWHVVAQRMEADGRTGGRPPMAQVCALLRLLSAHATSTPALEAESEDAVEPVQDRASQRLAAGYARSHRSRDGPAFFA